MVVSPKKEARSIKTMANKAPHYEHDSLALWRAICAGCRCLDIPSVGSVRPLQLLEFSVTEGWEPLCGFLEVPVPDVPFPWVNSTEEMTATFRRSVRGCSSP